MRILLKVSVPRPCHGVGRGQTIRVGKLGNAIGTQGEGKGGSIREKVISLRFTVLNV